MSFTGRRRTRVRLFFFFSLPPLLKLTRLPHRRTDAKTWVDEQLGTVLHHLLHRKNLLSLNLYVTETPSAPASASSKPIASPALATSSALAYNEKEDLELTSSSKSGSSSSFVFSFSFPFLTLTDHPPPLPSPPIYSAPSALPWTLHPPSTRPCIPSLFASLFAPSSPSPCASSCAAAAGGSMIGVAACGPESLTNDVRRAVAAKQKEIALGRGRGVEEVELAVEAFDW